MFARLLPLAAPALLVLVGACAPEPEPAPEPIYPQPTYDKYGQATCPEGYVVDAAGQACLPAS